MEKLSTVARYFRWMRDERGSEKCDESSSAGEECATNNKIECKFETTKRFLAILESILLWENSVNSVFVVIVFNLLFWGIVVSEVRGFAAASSAALVVVLCYGTLEVQMRKSDEASQSPTSRARTERIDEIVCKLRAMAKSLKELRRGRGGTFCAAVGAFSLGLWLIGRTVNSVLLAYTICMSVLVGPALLLQVYSQVLHSKEWDSEIEEFLPAATDDNLQVLNRAGESGDHSPTPTGAPPETQNDPFNDEELVGLKMPSHEDGSTDGLELSELELSAGDQEVDGIKFQSGHFERGSSSEEEAELSPLPKKLPSHGEDSDSDFEIIDSREIANANNV